LRCFDPLEYVEGCFCVCPINEHSQLKQEGNLHETTEDPSVVLRVVAHHEVRLHELRQSLLDLDGTEIEVEAVEHVEDPDVRVAVQVVAVVLLDVTFFTVALVVGCTQLVPGDRKNEEQVDVDYNENNPLEVELHDIPEADLRFGEQLLYVDPNLLQAGVLPRVHRLQGRVAGDRKAQGARLRRRRLEHGFILLVQVHRIVGDLLLLDYIVEVLSRLSSNPVPVDVLLLVLVVFDLREDAVDLLLALLPLFLLNE